MKKLFGTLIVLTSIAVSSNSFGAAHVGKNMSHIHMGHVSTQWGDTPNQAGLLPTAMKEAEIALTHATIATKQLNNLNWLKTHTLHVVNAINPRIIPKGPGLGYGFIKAAQGVEKHIKLAANSADASANVKLHAIHVSTSAHNSIVRANKILELAVKVKKSTSANQAAPFVKRIHALAQQIVEGYDANGDGVISWVKNEGGLKASSKHLGIMQKGEGMASM